MKEKFKVAVCTPDSALGMGEDPPAGRACSFGDQTDCLSCLIGRAHHATGVQCSRSQFELGLHQHQDTGLGAKQSIDGRKHFGQRDEGQIGDCHWKAMHGRRLAPLLEHGLELFRLEISKVGVLQADHARVGTQIGVQLPMTHLDTNHPGCAMLQQAVGKAACGLTQIKHLESLGIDRKFDEGMHQLGTRPGNKSCFIRGMDLQDLMLAHDLRRPAQYDAACKAHCTILNQTLRSRARGSQPPCHQSLISTHQGCLKPAARRKPDAPRKTGHRA